MTRDINNYYEKISKKCKIKIKDKFDVLIVDPPWNQGQQGYRGTRHNRTQKLDYPTLSTDEIM